MGLYRRNSNIVFHAVKFDPFGENKSKILKPVNALCENEHEENSCCEQCHFWIETLEGEMEVMPGDYIVTGVEKEKWAIKPSIFEKTYTEIYMIEKEYEI